MSKQDEIAKKMANKGRRRSPHEALMGNASNSNSKNENNNNSAIDELLGDQKTKDQTHVYKGFYLENEVGRVIDNVTAGKSRGAKSNLVNEILKKYFQNEGLM